MITNLEEMKQRLEEIKLQASGWMSSTDGSYEACLNADSAIIFVNLLPLRIRKSTIIIPQSKKWQKISLHEKRIIRNGIMSW